MSFEPLLKDIGMEKADIKQFAEAKGGLTLINQLEKEAKLLEAVQCMAHLLPPRESVWWACQAIKESGLKGAEPEAKAAVKAAEQWAMKPTEPNRLNAGKLSDEAGTNTCEGMVALAAKLATGNMAADENGNADDHVDMPPPEKLYAKMSAGSVLLAMLKKLPEGDAFLSTSLETGKDVLRKNKK